MFTIWIKEDVMRCLCVMSLVVVLSTVGSTVGSAEPDSRSCWGQATQVFARMGAMGEHARQQPSPRIGLANLAEDLADAGIIPEPTMQALGAFVADELGLSIEACM
jgi:hypothetical protein